jgi:threonine dehydrogenase-like Zn-dependent dehydrogenase
MAHAVAQTERRGRAKVDSMRAAVFRGHERIVIEEHPMPACGPSDAIVKVTLTTICGTDVHIWREEYPVRQGLIIGHEPVGVIHQLGEAVEGYAVGDRVLVGAITPCGTCFYCQSHNEAQCSGYQDDWQMIGGWRFGNSIDGVQAEYFRVPYAQANLARIPDDLTDEQCVLLADIASTGISAAETAEVTIGQTVAVFAQGPIGLCATAGARLKGASLVIGVDTIEGRLKLSRQMGADEVIDFTQEDPVAGHQAPDRRPRRRRRDRGAGQAGDLPVVPGSHAPGRNRLEPRCLRRQARRPARIVRVRDRRQEDPHDAVPGRQGADAQVDGHGPPRAPEPHPADHAQLRAG